jgi:membrane protease subunit (stomatin/prohibitin family)
MQKCEDLSVIGIQFLELGDFSINFDAEDQKRLEEAQARYADLKVKRRAKDELGDGNYMQYAAGEAMLGAGQGMAKGGGEGGGAMQGGAGMGMGFAMAQMFANQMQQRPPQQGYGPPGYPPQQGFPPQQGYPPPGYPPQQGFPAQGAPPQQGWGAPPAAPPMAPGGAPQAAGGNVSCASCGASVPPGRFCAECGASLAPPQPKPCPACGTVAAPGARFCANCGTGLQG